MYEKNIPAFQFRATIFFSSCVFVIAKEKKELKMSVISRDINFTRYKIYTHRLIGPRREDARAASFKKLKIKKNNFPFLRK